jgi:hypothetical protein
MPKPKFQWNLPAFKELRTNPKVVDHIDEIARSIKEIAGDGFEVGDTQSPRNRAHAIVYTDTPEARMKNAAEHTLIRALGSVSGQTLNLYTTKSGKTRLATDAQVANWTRGSR